MPTGKYPIFKPLFSFIWSRHTRTAVLMLERLQSDTADFAPVLPPGELDETYTTSLF